MPDVPFTQENAAALAELLKRVDKLEGKEEKEPGADGSPDDATDSSMHGGEAEEGATFQGVNAEGSSEETPSSGRGKRGQTY